MINILLLLTTLMVNMTYAAPKIQLDLPLKYIAQESASKDRPIIIFLHGYGSNEEDLFELKGELPGDYNYLSVQAPQFLSPGSYQWYSLTDTKDVEKDLKIAQTLILDFINSAAKKYHTQKNKVILIGFSQGAIMNFEVILRHPEAVKGAAMLSGKILPGLKPSVSAGMDLKHLSLFIGHGTKDDRVPFRESTEANTLLEKTSIKPEFHSYQGMGHSINHEELKDLKAWIEKTLK